jgi:hypothetical protein
MAQWRLHNNDDKIREKNIMALLLRQSNSAVTNPAAHLLHTYLLLDENFCFVDCV